MAKTQPFGFEATYTPASNRASSRSHQKSRPLGGRPAGGV
ncbi:MAG TPA: flavodoxin [Lactobacillus sp.]|nr:flavodoxin [Lactobacillus sp.]